MTRHSLSRALLALAIAVPLYAQASPLGPKPGAWEITVTVVYSHIPKPTEEQLASMAPERRAKVLETVKSHEGVAETRIGQHCVKDSDTLDRLTENHPEKDGCTRKLVSKTATSIEVSARCARPAPNQARIRVVAQYPVSVLTDIDADYENGMKMHKEARSRWIGPSCAGLRPMPPGAMPQPESR